MHLINIFASLFCFYLRVSFHFYISPIAALCKIFCELFIFKKCHINKVILLHEGLSVFINLITISYLVEETSQQWPEREQGHFRNIWQENFLCVLQDRISGVTWMKCYVHTDKWMTQLVGIPITCFLHYFLICIILF